MAYKVCFLFLVFLYFSGLNISVNANKCGQQRFTSDHGGIIKFKGNSSSPRSCTYEINVQRGRRIVLEWGRFIVNGDMPSCVKSTVTVYIG